MIGAVADYKKRNPLLVKATQAKCLSNPERRAARRAAFMEYMKTARGKASRAASVLRWSARHPDRRRAQVAVNRAIASGALEKKPCETCGATQAIHGHHEDYSRPLEVRWLCRDHHAARHRELRDGAP